MTRKISPEQRALNDLVRSEVAEEIYLSKIVPLHYVLSAIYRAGGGGSCNTRAVICWNSDEILVTCGLNHLITLRFIRQKLEQLTFTPYGWTVFFKLEDDAYQLDSLSFIHLEQSD